nr:conserved hypothetical protein [uncultured archaeon]
MGLGRVLVGGAGRGRPLVLDSPISPLGDIDPERGTLRGTGEELRGRLLMFPYAVGSSVGSYVLYSIASRGLAPAAVLVRRADPMLVSGCALGGIPLAELGDAYDGAKSVLSGCGLARFSASVGGGLELACEGSS